MVILPSTHLTADSWIFEALPRWEVLLLPDWSRLGFRAHPHSLALMTWGVCWPRLHIICHLNGLAKWSWGGVILGMGYKRYSVMIKILKYDYDFSFHIWKITVTPRTEIEWNCEIYTSTWFCEIVVDRPSDEPWVSAMQSIVPLDGGSMYPFLFFGT